MKRTALTLEELSALPDDATTYKPVGKSYFLTPKQQLVQQLQENITSDNEEVTKLNQQKEHAEKAIMATENEIRELIKQHPEAAAAFQQMLR
eukprot:jgi/Chrzof1/10374/Cz04g39170.t1